MTTAFVSVLFIPQLRPQQIPALVAALQKVAGRGGPQALAFLSGEAVNVHELRATVPLSRRQSRRAPPEAVPRVAVQLVNAFEGSK